MTLNLEWLIERMVYIRPQSIFIDVTLVWWYHRTLISVIEVQFYLTLNSI